MRGTEKTSRTSHVSTSTTCSSCPHLSSQHSPRTQLPGSSCDRSQRRQLPRRPSIKKWQMFSFKIASNCLSVPGAIGQEYWSQKPMTPAVLVQVFNHRSLIWMIFPSASTSKPVVLVEKRAISPNERVIFVWIIECFSENETKTLPFTRLMHCDSFYSYKWGTLNILGFYSPKFEVNFLNSKRF